MPFLAPLIPAVIGAAGSVAGALAGGSQSSSQSTSVQKTDETAFSKGFGNGASSSYGELGNLVNAGPGQADVQAGAQSQRSLADLLSQYQQSGGVPGQQDVTQANKFASQVFQPQQVAMQQAFQQQQWNANRNAALSGRTADDPILAAKLAQEQTRQQSMLQAQQGSFGAQYAQDVSQNRLGYAQSKANVLQGLASQALSNRQALASLGGQLRQGELGWATRTTNTQGTSQQGPDAGARVAQGISGGLAGIGAGFGLANSFGGGGGSMPSFSNMFGGGNSQDRGVGANGGFSMAYPTQNTQLGGVEQRLASNNATTQF